MVHDPCKEKGTCGGNIDRRERLLPTALKMDGVTGMIRALENSGTLPWKYRGTPYEKVLDPDGVTTEYVRCPDPTASGIVIKITRTPWKDKVLRVCAMQRIAQTQYHLYTRTCLPRQYAESSSSPAAASR